MIKASKKITRFFYYITINYFELIYKNIKYGNP